MSRRHHHRTRARGNGLLFLGAFALIALGVYGLVFRFTGERKHPWWLLFGSLTSLSTGFSVFATATGRRAWSRRGDKIADAGDAIQASLEHLDPFARVQVLKDLAIAEARRAGAAIPNVPGLDRVPILNRFAA